MGKEKYGGPFTTEEVENVKAFLGIVSVLLTTGPTFFVEFIFSENLPVLLQILYFCSFRLINILIFMPVAV